MESKPREIEKECSKHGSCLHVYVINAKRYRCKKCRVDAVQKRREVVKIKAVDYKGGKCEKCGYNKYVGALDFHHTDPTQKDFAIASKGYTRSWEKVKNELDKCMILCSNCHREIHNGIE